MGINFGTSVRVQQEELRRGQELRSMNTCQSSSVLTTLTGPAVSPLRMALFSHTSTLCRVSMPENSSGDTADADSAGDQEMKRACHRC